MFTRVLSAIKNNWLFLLLSTLLFSLSVLSGTSHAFFDLNTKEYLSFLPGLGANEDGIEGAANLVQRAFGVIRLLIGTIAILVGLIGSLRLIMARGDEGEYTKARETLLYGAVGLVIVALSGDISEILSPYRGGLLGSDAILQERTLIFDNAVRIVITFIKYLAGALAVFMLIRVGFRMVTLSEAEDELGKDKQSIVLISIGLLILVFGDSLIRNIFYVVDSPSQPSPSINLPGAMQELISFINLIVILVGPIVILTFVAGGLMYVLSGVNEDFKNRGRRMMVVSLVGMITVYGAFALVNTFILGQF